MDCAQLLHMPKRMKDGLKGPKTRLVVRNRSVMSLEVTVAALVVLLHSLSNWPCHLLKRQVTLASICSHIPHP
jgi:hypothetical protein